MPASQLYARMKNPHEMASPNGLISQLTAVADLRWHMFLNGLRTRRGKTELVSHVIVGSAFAVAGIGAFAAALGMSWFCVSQGKPEGLALLMWAFFLLWQIFPIMATAFTNNPDSSDLLRFPLTYRSYFLIRLAYGFFDPASALGTVGLLGVLLGITAARPSLFPWAVVVVFTFVLFNLVLMQTVFAWLERWLAQRRTREIFGVIFILFVLSFQLIGPTVQHFERKPQPELEKTFAIVARVQGALPPGLASSAIAQTARSHYFVGFTSWLFLSALTLAVGFLLHLRLWRQFRGENLSEAEARPVRTQVQGLQIGWQFPGASPAVAAVFEKEMRYLGRSGPMLLTLIMPVFMLMVFRFGAMNAMHHSSFITRTPDMAFPAAAAYALLVLTNLVYNSFGGDSAGMQFFYASPATFSDIVLGKNLAYASILAANTILALIAVAFFYGMPHTAVIFATLAGILFAAPLNFTVGNLLSIYSPKKRDFATFGRQNVSQTTVLISLGVQVVIVALGAAAFAVARYYRNFWIAAVAFLVLALISIPLYVMVLRRMDAIAVERREVLLSELCRA
jgi:ABC-2 type transport system permease protein